MKDSKKISDCQPAKFGSIYLIYCYVTDMCYVGQTIQKVSARIGKHKSGRQYIDKEIQKLGWENFTYIVLEKNVPIEKLNSLEKYWIKVFDCIAPKGYNKTIGGTGSTIVSEMTRTLLSEINSGKNNYFYDMHRYGEENPFHGHHHTDETKALLSEIMRGRKNPKHSARMKGAGNPMFGRFGAENPMFGKPAHNRGKHPDATTRKKMSDAKKGKTTWNKGIPCSEETKEKIRMGHLRRKILREILEELHEVLA